jgi:serine/threonine-protein kinase
MAERMLVRPRSAGTLDSGADSLVDARGLPTDLLGEASRRLEATSVLVGVAFGIVLLLNNTLRAAGWPAVPRPALHNSIALTMIAVSAALLGLCRSRRVEARRLLDIGLVYELVVSLGISMGDHLAPLTSERPLETISWLCVWIVMFPLVVPTTTGKALLASLAAASTWPLAYAIGLSLGQPAAATPIVLLNALENYIAAGLALVPALVVRRLGAHVERARAMGSYELVERLDSGGMGEIWRARHRMLARPAAIKLIRPEALGAAGGRLAESLLRRFEREAQATATLHSPHTIELYDFGVTREGTLYYVMEILDGLDLDALVRRFGPVPAERAVHLLLQACDSLADAHHAGLVHRDVKPANIYVCRKGLRRDFVKVLDFGLVKASWADEGSDTRLTVEGIAGGTPAFIAPEVALGDGKVDARADLYALGCVGYWLLTGHTVFAAQTAMQMALHHVHTAPQPPSGRTELLIPEALERVLLSCLEKDPERRPASALELVDRLAACPLESPWTPERSGRWWDSHLPAPAIPA